MAPQKLTFDLEAICLSFTVWILLLFLANKGVEMQHFCYTGPVSQWRMLVAYLSVEFAGWDTSCDIGRVKISKSEEKGSASVILCGCAPTPGRSLCLDVCLRFKLQWEVQVTAVEIIHLFICRAAIRLCWTLGVIFATGIALKHSRWHKIQLYNLHGGWVTAFHWGKLHWLVVKYLSPGTWGICDYEIRAVFLAEDGTFKVGGFFIWPVPYVACAVVVV